jgi:hypothetical protein
MDLILTGDKDFSRSRFKAPYGLFTIYDAGIFEIIISLSAPPKIIVPAWREGGIFSTQAQVGT